MVSKTQVVIAAVFGVVAVLYQINTDTTTWEATQSGTLYTSPHLLQRFITNPDQVEKWFQLVTHFKAADSRPLGIGKKYQAIYDVPVLGEYVMLLTVVEYRASQVIVLESNALLRPRLTIKMEEKTPKTTLLTFSVRYRRSSALFQWTVAPVLNFLSRQQMQRSIFLLRMFFPI